MARMALLVVLALLPRLAAAQAQTMVRAAGMPLNDGALAPGMLTVRVVEGAFTRDLAGLAVDVQVTGGKAARAVTGADGRAQFAHLPIGADVHAFTVVGDERLESSAFVMPADSGVRLLLVAGAGAGAAPPADTGSPIRTIRFALVLTTVFVFALFMLRRRPRRS